jgi:isopropylmalate/homocitrate/citramalate synthase
VAQRNAEPWHTDQWFTSLWNYLPEVTSGFTFPKELKIHDITLRDGEQQAGVVLTADEKVRIAEGLADAGVHRIEAGLPAVSPADEEAVRRIAGLGLPSEIYAFCRCVTSDVRLAADCGVKAVVMEVPASGHLIEKAYGWTKEKALDVTIEATAYAHELGLKVVFFPIDATRAPMVELMDDLSRVAREGHADAIVLVDTMGVISPHAVGFFVRSTRERLGIPLEAHFHQDFGLGVANTVIAATQGVEALHTTVAGIGERSGNTPMEETVMALLTMYGIDMGIKTEKFYELSRLVLGLTGVVQAPNKPVIGDALFHIESGIPTAWLRKLGEKDMLEVFPYRPGLVGQPAPVTLLGKGAGLDSIAFGLERIGMKWSSTEELRVILTDVKAASLEKKGLLTDAEFETIARKTLSGTAG